MIKKLQIKIISIIMIIITIMLFAILGTVVLSTYMDIQRESIQTLLDIPNTSGKPLTPYITIKVDHRSSYMLVEGKYYEDNDIDFVKLVYEVNRTSDSMGILPKYKLRYLKEHSIDYDIYTFTDITNEILAMNSLIKSSIISGICSYFIFFIITVLLVKFITHPIETAWNQQKQFVGDASHELKTPLTVILTNAELLEDPESTETDRKKYASNIHSMSLQMRGLVEQLLDLARTDNNNLKASFERLSLSELSDTEVMMFEPSFFEKDLLLNADIHSDIYVYGSSSHIKQAIDILLDNAIKYTTDKGHVSVCLKNTGYGKCQFSVESEGTPLSKQDIKNIFKRFYRIDTSRSMNGSYGLGLSIAWNIMKQHGGKIFAEAKKSSNVFVLEFSIKK